MKKRKIVFFVEPKPNVYREVEVEYDEDVTEETINADFNGWLETQFVSTGWYELGKDVQEKEST